MMNRFLPGVMVAAAMALVAGTNGCSSSDLSPSSLCCTDFQPGTDMSSVDFGGDASIKGQIEVFANATGDMSAVAGTALADVTAACMNIAVDLGADPNANSGGDGGAAKTGTDALDFWCNLAASSVGASVKAAGSVSLTVVPPVCEASVSVTANCNAKCDVSGQCNAEANPPTCEGGTLEASCTGDCTASASAPSFDCTGSCAVGCTGQCTAQGGVDCSGKCDGSCSVATDSNGNCNGTCKGTCSVMAPSAQCSGTCEGKCSGTCKAAPGQASATCSGTCSVKATPLSCKGGTLKASCNVDANCSANCNASAQAKASCTPPSVTLVANGTVSANFDALSATLQKNLPALINVILAQGKTFSANLEAAVSGGASITASGKLDVKSTACLAQMVAAATSASANFAKVLSASVSVSTAAGGPTG